MGCFYSSLNRIQIQHSFNSEDIININQSWNILKTHDIIKFADQVLLRMIHQNPLYRQFWISKLDIESNNYDFSEGESCLRTDRSWLIGIREHSIQFTLLFDRLISSIKNENILIKEIRSIRLLQNMFIFEYDHLIIIKQCIIEVIRERFQLFKYEFTIDYEQAWNKFLSFIIKYLLEKDNQIRGPAKIIISPATAIDQTSMNKLN